MKRQTTDISSKVVVLIAVILIVVCVALAYTITASIVGSRTGGPWGASSVIQLNQAIVAVCVALLVLAVVALLVATHLSHAQSRHIDRLVVAKRYDPLTGLANFSQFFELAEISYNEVKARGGVPAMLFMDFASMKTFNQKYGFSEGDRLLKDFADLLVKHFGADRCCRIGQDHFAVSTDAERLDERLDLFLEECAGINGGKNLPVRIGIHLDTMGEVDVSTACDRAKAARTSQRTISSSFYRYYSPDMLLLEERRRHIVDNFDRALAEGWIEVHYQPIVRASTGLVCDEEALARWRDPEYGLLNPDDFVPILEDARIVYKLDLYVLEQTLAKMHAMAAANLHVVSASVNLSRSDFKACDIVDEVRRRVSDSEIDPSLINLEITESTMGSDVEFMKQQVKRFHDLGFKVWMDDFGSEYSTLDSLQSLDFDLIKFDMRFMQQFHTNEKSRVILLELVKMALGLGVDTVAEGVETQEQVDFLREIGCSKMQGFYFTTPHPVQEIFRRYEEGDAIGFENPVEADYYSALGRLNLYDLSSVARGDEEGLEYYFDTLPMAVLEYCDESLTIVRCNSSYRDFMLKSFSAIHVGVRVPRKVLQEKGGPGLMDAVGSHAAVNERISIYEDLPNGTRVHSLARHVADNPTTGMSAWVVAVLAVAER